VSAVAVLLVLFVFLPIFLGGAHGFVPRGARFLGRGGCQGKKQVWLLGSVCSRMLGVFCPWGALWAERRRIFFKLIELRGCA